MRSSIKILISTMILAIGLAGCASFFGGKTQEEHIGQRVFQTNAKYVYFAIPLSKFVNVVGVEPANKAAICELHSAVARGFDAVAAARSSGADTLTAALAGASGSLASLGLKVIGSVSVPSTEDLIQKTVVWLQVGTLSVAEMRFWRKGYMNEKMGQFIAEERDPTEAEFAEVSDKANELRAIIDAGCTA